MQRRDLVDYATLSVVWGVSFVVLLRVVQAFGWVGAVMSALAYVLFFRLVADLGATKAISVEFVVTAIAVLLGSLVLDERLSAIQLVGAVVIVGGCALVLGLVPRSRAA